MNNHIKFAIPDTTICARHADSLGKFLATEAEGLKEILDLFAECEASDAVVELEGLCTAVPPDVTAIGMALETVLHAIESIPFLVLEHVAMSGQGPRDLHAAVRWYGGRIADLSDAFPG